MSNRKRAAEMPVVLGVCCVGLAGCLAGPAPQSNLITPEFASLIGQPIFPRTPASTGDSILVLCQNEVTRPDLLTGTIPTVIFHVALEFNSVVGCDGMTREQTSIDLVVPPGSLVGMRVPFTNEKFVRRIGLRKAPPQEIECLDGTTALVDILFSPLTGDDPEGFLTVAEESVLPQITLIPRSAVGGTATQISTTGNFGPIIYEPALGLTPFQPGDVIILAAFVDVGQQERVVVSPGIFPGSSEVGQRFDPDLFQTLSILEALAGG